ncbi:MAG: ribonuclease HII [Bacteroidetes bacterium]|nr:ribonuclease HII [Bacteroidota bacterium]MCZ6898895.1 ribonuclease HII [Bacteroidota bacterium]
MLKSAFSPDLMEAGCDETGRGCLAGPVVAAAVILPKNYQNRLLTDSKQLSKKKRIKLEKEIKTKALAWAIAEASHQEIDKINILNASFLAMHRAIDKLNEKPRLLLIDGNRFNPYPTVPHQCIIKGDATYLSIAAASVLAKNYRDRKMEQLGDDYPAYGWNTNVGYPTPGHREAIKEIGLSPWHRLSFRQLPSQLELFESN